MRNFSKIFFLLQVTILAGCEHEIRSPRQDFHNQQNDVYTDKIVYDLMDSFTIHTSIIDLEKALGARFHKTKEKKWSENNSDNIYELVLNGDFPYKISYFESIELGQLKRTSTSFEFIGRQAPPTCLSLRSVSNEVVRLGWKSPTPFLAPETHGFVTSRNQVKLTVFADVGGGEGVPSDYNKALTADFEGCVVKFIMQPEK